MPTREQVAFHNDEQLRLDEERRRREAAIRAEEQSRLIGYQQQQQAQQQQVQQQAQQQTFGYQQNLNAQNALNSQIGQYDQYRYQSALSQQGAQQNLQAGQQEHAQTQQRMQYGTDLQAHLSEVQLTQRDNLRRQQLKDAIASLDDDVLHRRLAPEEAAIMRTRLQTGLNPLEGREQQARIIQGMIQTQGIHQQNEMQATLFNQRQSVLATNPQDRFRSVMVDDGEGNQIPVTFGLTPDGNWEMVDITQIQRRREEHRLGMRQGEANITQTGVRTNILEMQLSEMPERFQSDMRTAITQRNYTRANQILTEWQAARIEGTLPEDIAAMRASVALHQAQTNRITGLLPFEQRNMEANTNSLDATTAFNRSRTEIMGRMAPVELAAAEATFLDNYNSGTIRQVTTDATTAVDAALQNGSLVRPRQPGEAPQNSARLDREFRDNAIRQERLRILSNRRPEVNRQAQDRRAALIADITQGVERNLERAMEAFQRDNPNQPLPAHLTPENWAGTVRTRVNSILEGINPHLSEDTRFTLPPTPTPTPRPDPTALEEALGRIRGGSVGNGGIGTGPGQGAQGRGVPTAAEQLNARVIALATANPAQGRALYIRAAEADARFGGSREDRARRAGQRWDEETDSWRRQEMRWAIPFVDQLDEREQSDVLRGSSLVPG